MIKLTRGALTMLLAQYRGILKNAWIKNFAVAAALATSVTSAYADPAEVKTWEDAVKGAVALNGTAGVLNIQASADWKANPGTITITGGENHKIGHPAATANVSSLLSLVVIATRLVLLTKIKTSLSMQRMRLPTLTLLSMVRIQMLP